MDDRDLVGYGCFGGAGLTNRPLDVTIVLLTIALVLLGYVLWMLVY